MGTHPRVPRALADQKPGLVDPATAFQALGNPYTDPRTDTVYDDVLDWKNPLWQEAGVVTPGGANSETLNTRNSFPARRAAARVLEQLMGLTVTN